ncbi:hypothetical protein [Croceivirga thetidis]|uniref:DUF3098 domain-containing protein n=1 Tax=Croceivirga thetidis TaxID=2721623 RepID=A0ABX1GM34_9FLAO|nr:hypothetical protein [Croceivirga thetidis]NKI30982.1 hypothetical protein [Croceivirga thetidis]
MKLKYLIVFIVLASFGSIIYGFNLEDAAGSLRHRYIGFGTIGLFLVAMPLFLIKESRGKKMKDYMLTKENIEKMQKKDRDQPKNQ